MWHGQLLSAADIEVRWFGHRKDSGYIGKRMLNMERKRGRPRRTFMDLVQDMWVGVGEEDTRD